MPADGPSGWCEAGNGCPAAAGEGLGRGRGDGATVVASPRSLAARGNTGGARGGESRRGVSVAVVGVPVASGGEPRAGCAEPAAVGCTPT